MSAVNLDMYSLHSAVYHEDNTFGKIVQSVSDFRFDLVTKVVCDVSKQTGLIYPETSGEPLDTKYVCMYVCMYVYVITLPGVL